jgi:hypothetical protein
MNLFFWAVFIAICLVLLWCCWNMTRPNDLDKAFERANKKALEQRQDDILKAYYESQGL